MCRDTPFFASWHFFWRLFVYFLFSGTYPGSINSACPSCGFRGRGYQPLSPDIAWEFCSFFFSSSTEPRMYVWFILYRVSTWNFRFDGAVDG